jgi:hypothetical protein
MSHNTGKRILCSLAALFTSIFSLCFIYQKELFERKQDLMGDPYVAADGHTYERSRLG